MIKIKNRKINLLFCLCFLVVLLALPIQNVYAKYEISKSKKATNLDSNYQSKITLSTPINDGNSFYDFVFVLDKSSSGNGDVRRAILSFYDELKNNNENIKVGVVSFYNKAEIVKSFTDTDIHTVSGSGTNLSAGILLGTQMLDEDVSVPSSHKFLILISDGDTHVFNKNNSVDGAPTVIAQSANSANSSIIAGPASYSNKYSNFDPPDDWDEYLATIGKCIENDGDLYENPYNIKGNNKYNDSDKYVPFDEISSHAVSVDKALYYSYVDYLAAQAKGYNTFTVPLDSAYGRTYGTSFMKFLGSGNEISIDSLIDITYMLGPGTTIVDYIGSGKNEDGIDYDFNVIDDIDNYSVKINGEETDISKIETTEGATSTYGAGINNDGSYKYIINYYAGDNERLELIYNVVVSRLEPLEITYSVKLTNPALIDGHYTGLNTNNDCIIKIIDNDGNLVGEEHFEKPTVEYTVLPSVDPESPESPSKNPDTDSNLPIPSGDTNSSSVSLNDKIRNPKTGDNIIMYIIMLVVGILGLTITIMLEKMKNKK